ncbi:MAG: hypothetical protein ABIF09_05795 [Gemmatimonadota bacterium]
MANRKPMRESELVIRRKLKRFKQLRNRSRSIERNKLRKYARTREMRAKAGLMVIDRAHGQSVAELSQKYQVSEQSVKAHLKLGSQLGVVNKHVVQVINQLVPKALAVYDKTMDDIFQEVNPTVMAAATRVLEGTGVLQRTPPPMLVQPPESNGQITTIEEYRAWRSTTLNMPSTGPPEGQVIEGTTVGEDDHVESEHRDESGAAVHDRGEEAARRQLSGDLHELPGAAARDGADPA